MLAQGPSRPSQPSSLRRAWARPVTPEPANFVRPGGIPSGHGPSPRRGPGPPRPSRPTSFARVEIPRGMAWPAAPGPAKFASPGVVGMARSRGVGPARHARAGSPGWESLWGMASSRGEGPARPARAGQGSGMARSDVGWPRAAATEPAPSASRPTSFARVESPQGMA